MYRKIIFLLLFSLLLQANKIEIDAKYFEGSQKNQFGIFKDAVIKNNDDYLKCDILKVKLNNANKIVNYTANNVKDFSLTLNQKIFKGKSDQIIYNVLNDTYELIGNIKILEADKELKADYIIIDKKAGTYKVKSNDNKPVKLIFEIAK